MREQHNTSTPTGQSVTLEDIAQQVGASRATVSRALQNSPLLKAETIARIQAVAAEMGYNPGRFHLARRLVARRSGRRVLNSQIALLFPTHFYEAHYFNAIFTGLMDQITPAGFSVVITLMPDLRVDHFPFQLPPNITRGEVDGIIMIAGNPGGYEEFVHTHLRQYIDERTVPLVALIAPAAGNAAVVQTDDEAGGYAAARHLLELGHRHLLFLHDGIGHDSYRRRRDGTLRALKEHAGVNTSLQHFLSLETTAIPVLTQNTLAEQNTTTPDEHPLVQLLRAESRYTGLLAQNDFMARRYWYLLRNAGWRIPEDFSLIGYDDTDPIPDDTGTKNLLTSVRLPLVEVGRHAADILLALIKDEEVPDTRIMLPTQLMVRQTTGPCKDEGEGIRRSGC